MAIQDRNLSVGTKLYARYKGATYTAEVVEVQTLPAGMLPTDAPADPDPRLVTELRYRLMLQGWSEPQDFKSPSAAGAKVTGKSCNGWAFWSVGDGSENTGPVTSTKARPPTSSTITPAPKPQGKRRGKKSQEPPATDGSEAADEPPASEGEASNEAHDDAPTAAEPDQQPVTCAECGETFPGVAAATEHYYATHGKPESDEPTTEQL
jgi:hypothetical protein